MNQIMTQTKPTKLVECNRCKDAGFPNEKITFINSGQKKADGKILWNLLNEDYSIHIHKSPTEKFQSIENDKPAARPIMNVNVNEKLELTQDEIIYLKQLVAFMKVVK